MKRAFGQLLKPVAKIYFSFLSGKKIPDFFRKPIMLYVFSKLYFTYVPDKEQFGKEDYWQTAIEMLHRRKGDCEDWSVFFRQTLLPKYNATLFYVSYKDLGGQLKAHISCVFDHGVIDNLGLFKIGEKDAFKAIAKRIVHKLDKKGLLHIYYVVDRDNKPVRY